LIYNPFDLSGRKYLVTGASSGIGRGVCHLLDRLGAQVLLTGRDPARLNETRTSLSNGAHGVEPWDLSATAEIPARLKLITTQFGALHGVVHCAGIHQLKPVRFLSDESWNEVLNVNLTTAFEIVKGYRQKGSHASPASVVLLSSVMGLVGQPGASAYCASKGAIIALTRSLALELAPEGIRVNCIAPGQVRTEMTERQRQTLTADQFTAIEGMHPLGIGEVLDVANAAAFLLADTSRWVTGTTLVVDGGYTAN
jgi:NAD(P)-dependent dehydrogenase (short-subunit alcohol dehydrogenase family)